MKNNSKEDRCSYLRILLWAFQIFGQWKFIDSKQKLKNCKNSASNNLEKAVLTP